MKPMKFLLKSIINQIEFKVCFGLLIVLSFGSFLLNCIHYFGSDYLWVRSAADAFILTSTSSRALVFAFYLIFPLIAATLCSGYRKKNEKKGDGLFSMMRIGKSQYILGNAVMIVVITVISFIIFFALNQILCLITFPITGIDNRWGVSVYQMYTVYDEKMLFDFWQIQNPYIYNLLYSVIISILGGGISLLAYGACFINSTNRLNFIQLAMVLFTFFMAMEVAGQMVNLQGIGYLSFVETGHHVSVLQCVIYILTVYAIGIILCAKGMNNYEYI